MGLRIVHRDTDAKYYVPYANAVECANAFFDQKLTQELRRLHSQSIHIYIAFLIDQKYRVVDMGAEAWED